MKIFGNTVAALFIKKCENQKEAIIEENLEEAYFVLREKLWTQAQV